MITKRKSSDTSTPSKLNSLAPVETSFALTIACARSRCVTSPIIPIAPTCVTSRRHRTLTAMTFRTCRMMAPSAEAVAKYSVYVRCVLLRATDPSRHRTLASTASDADETSFAKMAQQLAKKAGLFGPDGAAKMTTLEGC